MRLPLLRQLCYIAAMVCLCIQLAYGINVSFGHQIAPSPLTVSTGRQKILSLWEDVNPSSDIFIIKRMMQ